MSEQNTNGHTTSVVNRIASNPEVATEKHVLRMILAKASEGEIVRWETLTTALGQKLNDIRWMIRDVRREMERDERITFDTLRRVGLQRSTNDDIPRIAVDTSAQKVRGIARRSARKLACAEFGRLNNDGKLAHGAAMAFIGILGMVSKAKSVAKLENAVKDTPDGVLPIGRTLEIFSKGRIESPNQSPERDDAR